MNLGPATHRDWKRARQYGFTLIEIIVVLLVFSVMAAMAYGGLNSVLKTRRAIEDAMDRSAEVQRAFLRLRGDFQNLRDRPARDSFGDAKAAFSMTREGEVSLIRGGWRSPMQSGRSSLERVRYQFKDGVLRRATWRAVDLPQESEPADLALLRNIEEVKWRFLDNGYEWQTQWPPENLSGSLQGSNANEPPPLAVEITLLTKDWGELRFLFRTPLSGLVSGTSSTGSTGGSTGASTSKLLTSEGLLPSSLLGSGSGSPSPNPNPDPGTETPNTPEPTPEPEPGPEDPGISSTSEEKSDGGSS